MTFTCLLGWETVFYPRGVTMLWGPLAVTVTLLQLCTSWQEADLGPGTGCGCLGACVAELPPQSVPHYQVSSPPSPHTSLSSSPRSWNTWTISPAFPVCPLCYFLTSVRTDLGPVHDRPLGYLARLPIAAGLGSEAAPSCRHKDPGVGPHRQESSEPAPGGACPPARLRSE